MLFRISDPLFSNEFPTEPLSGSGDDRVDGTSAGEVLYGKGGNDTVAGQGRADRLYGDVAEFTDDGAPVDKVFGDDLVSAAGAD